MPRVYGYFRDTEARRAALADERGEWNLFPGFFELEAYGWEVDLNLRQRPGTVSHHLGTWMSAYLHRYGGYGGDFAACLKTLGRANRADVVWSTVDTTGIPLSLFKAGGLLRPPLVYTSIGLIERFRDLPDRRWKRRQLRALAGCALVAAYGWEEAQTLKQWFPKTRVEFIPFAVDEAVWSPRDCAKTVDVLSLGMDWQRDFAALFPFARANPDRSVKIITSGYLRKALVDVPENVTLCDPVPLDRVAEEMAAARVVALPVRENTYSGATTTLLQAMALGLPTVVSEVGAIRDGYGFREKRSCVLVAPDSGAALSEALVSLLSNPNECAALGKRARAHVEAAFTRERFVAAWSERLNSLCSGGRI